MFFMVDKIEKLDNKEIPEKPSSTVGSRFAYHANPPRNILQNKFEFGANWIQNIVGAGEARTFDSNTEKFAEKQQKLENIKQKYENFSLQGGNKSQNEDERNLLDIKSLQTLREASDGLEEGDEIGTGTAVGFGVGLATATPLFQISFLPDLVQVYCLFW